MTIYFLDNAFYDDFGGAKIPENAMAISHLNSISHY